jgi:hypothetical protein
MPLYTIFFIRAIVTSSGPPGSETCPSMSETSSSTSFVSDMQSSESSRSLQLCGENR